MKTYRMVSWWLRKDALPWPNEALKDKFRRRADRLAGGRGKLGYHFRSAFPLGLLPGLGTLHELIRFVADEPHYARDMILLIITRQC